jgi:hypothetical protein
MKLPKDTRLCIDYELRNPELFGPSLDNHHLVVVEPKVSNWLQW